MRLIAATLFLCSALSAVPVKVNVASGNNAGGGSASSVATGAFDVTAGNLIVVFGREGSSNSLTGSVTDTAGNTYTLINYASLGAGNRCGMWYAKNIAGNPSNVVTLTFNGAAAFTAVSAVQYSGLDTVAPLDVSATGTAASAGSVTSGSFGTTAANEVIVAGASVNIPGSAFVAGAGYTIEAQDAGPLQAVEDKILSSSQSGASASMSGAGGANWEMIVAAFKSPPAGTYSFHRSIGIDHTKVGASDSANFTVLVSGTYPYLATLGNSGKIRNTVLCGVNSITCPADLIYTSDSACTTTLLWEIEDYSASTGLIVAWVKVPALSHNTDTRIYECYGNVAANTFKGGPRGAAWDANFKLVQHLPDGTTLRVADSTASANIAAANNASTAAGNIDGGASFNGSGTSYLSVPNNSSFDSTTGTWSGWIETSQSVGGQYPLLWARADSASLRGISLFLEASTARLRVQVYSDTSLVLDLSGGVALNDGAWHHIAFAFAGAGLANLFVDGSPVASGNPSAAWAFSGQVIRAGAALDSFWTPLNGSIDEFELSDVVRSADWLLAAYNNQTNPSTFYVVGNETGSSAAPAPKGGSQPFVG